jgi:hypothetical protein
MKNIVIVGYPKSGNTWITRLVAELIQCSVEGFWHSGHEEIASEGEDRVSEFACYKSHHQLHELEALPDQPWKIIYVIRDPRDIVFSGIPYFYRGYLKTSKPKILSSPLIARIYFHLAGRREMKRKMIKTVLEGDARTHRWCKVSWAEHVTPYLARASVLKMTYDSMLSDPVSGCRDILEHLSLRRTDAEINSAIRNQSFDIVKQKFQNAKEAGKAKFMREGRNAYWRSQLSTSEQQLFAATVGPQLLELGYAIYA